MPPEGVVVLGGSVTGSGLSRVELGQCALRNSLQHFFGEDSEQLPTNVQRLEHSSVVIGT